jgi:2-keto-4-pentenoate hydratase/2-oxohepta-3-ene-1,7-dioic acid hydratase in catechol pathway
VAVGLNYRDHAIETGYPIPGEPLLFMKPSTCVISNKDRVILPDVSERVDYEAELAIVIGKKAKNLHPEEVTAHLLGFSCFNDVTARDLQTSDGQWTRAKSFDTFGPYGPWIDLGIAPTDLPVQMFLNGQLAQDSRTSEFIFPVPELVSYISGIMTLLPGDVIITGTPAGIGPVKHGDQMEVRIGGIGSLLNTVG